MSEGTRSNLCDECGAFDCQSALANLTGHALDNKPLYESAHELILDTYRAQHSLNRPPRETFFGLNGLLLMIDFGYTGKQARDAHKRIADRSREWPVFKKHIRVPPTSASVATTISIDLMKTEQSIRKWAEAVWLAWSDDHERVRVETECRLGWKL